MITAEELELLTLFEVEPKKLDPNMPWSYNKLLYEVRQGDISLFFSVDPAYQDVRIHIRRGEVQLYELDAHEVQDVRYHDDRGWESLEIVVNSRDSISLHLKPVVRILHEVAHPTY
jgi:hypothetical protein